MKFGRSRKEAKDLKMNFGKVSQKSNLLEAMSDGEAYKDGVETGNPQQ